ncbi:DRMBL-domain-containing protein [Rhizoclosmatium globosum]|uniref:DRMBL-domain-containing protein n=1 Tax=Rhizoclosmatium globosum TaxID=329046 RepID=A0A1Y2C4K7_9FUNG|nr:DRMBL-domain-containing protein [Rhizoclosmatium globosum]|eukprot:ORY41962.1 DRMBL-domain-containing protein [Rhizoclosmatium globosum]
MEQWVWEQKLPGTGFTIDAFSYGAIEGCSAYFLSHFHSDHYGGLTSKFTAGPIYCSKVTANLVKSQLRVDAEYIKELPMETPIEVQGVTVTLIGMLVKVLYCGLVLINVLDANHCPALLPFHTAHPVLQNTRLKSVYLDTTYCDARYAFPNQQLVLEVVQQFILDVVVKGRKLEEVVAGESAGRNMMRQFLEMGGGGASSVLNLLGVGVAERGSCLCRDLHDWKRASVQELSIMFLLMSLAKALNCKVFAETAKRRILSQLEDEELDSMITTNPLDAAVHVIKIGQLNKEFLETKLNSVASKYARIIAIRPTGWTHHPRAAPAKPGQQSDEPAGFTLQSIKPTRLAHNIHVIPIPYSEHSSFTELKAFVKALNVEQIIPTVNISKHEMMKGMFDSWRSEG